MSEEVGNVSNEASVSKGIPHTGEVGRFKDYYTYNGKVHGTPVFYMMKAEGRSEEQFQEHIENVLLDMDRRIYDAASGMSFRIKEGKIGVLTDGKYLNKEELQKAVPKLSALKWALYSTVFNELYTKKFAEDAVKYSDSLERFQEWLQTAAAIEQLFNKRL